MQDDKIDYAQSGVDVNRGYEVVKAIKPLAESTFDSRVLGGIGGFGASFDIGGLGGQHPVLVSATDGVGTKLKYVDILDKHDTIGIDCVAMCVNDIVCQGAKPLFFLDYIAQSRISRGKVFDIVAGIVEGCKQAGVSLVGGETAEMPGFYQGEEYDIAGFCVGIVDKSKLIDGSKIVDSDVIIGLPSSGLHSNGFSLVRKLLGQDKTILTEHDSTLGTTLASQVLTPTRIYVKTILSLIDKFEIKGIAHITGGGWIENIPRMLPKDMTANMLDKAFVVPPIFDLLQKKSNMTKLEMYNTFNMGIGMVFVVDKYTAKQVTAECELMGERAFILGQVKKSTDGQNIKFL